MASADLFSATAKVLIPTIQAEHTPRKIVSLLPIFNAALAIKGVSHLWKPIKHTGLPDTYVPAAATATAAAVAHTDEEKAELKKHDLLVGYYTQMVFNNKQMLMFYYQSRNDEWPNGRIWIVKGSVDTLLGSTDLVIRLQCKQALDEIEYNPKSPPTVLINSISEVQQMFYTVRPLSDQDMIDCLHEKMPTPIKVAMMDEETRIDMKFNRQPTFSEMCQAIVKYYETLSSSNKDDRELSFFLGGGTNKGYDSSDNDDSDEDDSSDNYLNTDWNDLPGKAKEAATVLGFDQMIWDANDEVRVFDTDWEQLTEDQYRAAKALGYDEGTWCDDEDSEDEDTDEDDDNDTTEERKCYWCGKIGHSKRNCRDYAKVRHTLNCTHCGMYGHTAEICFDLHPELVGCTNLKSRLKSASTSNDDGDEGAEREVSTFECLFLSAGVTLAELYEDYDNSDEGYDGNELTFDEYDNTDRDGVSSNDDNKFDFINATSMGTGCNFIESNFEEEKVEEEIEDCEDFNIFETIEESNLATQQYALRRYGYEQGVNSSGGNKLSDNFDDDNDKKSNMSYWTTDLSNHSTHNESSDIEEVMIGLTGEGRNQGKEIGTYNAFRLGSMLEAVI